MANARALGWKRALWLGPFVLLAIDFVRYVALSKESRLAFLPDDAFYYFELGRSYARDGLWSFDRGRTLTSGFHPLFGYVCAAIEKAWPADGALSTRLTVHALIGVVTTMAALALMTATARAKFPRGAPLALVFVGLAGGMYICPLLGMEWPFALLADSILLFALATNRTRLLLAALFLGALCRSDAPALGVCLVIAELSIDPRLREKGAKKKIALICAAAIAGVVLVAIHTHVISGSFIQTSARTKSYWGSVTGYQPFYGLEPWSYTFSLGFLLTRVLDFGPATLLGAIALLILAWRSGRTSIAAWDRDKKVLLRFCALTIPVYALSYGRIGTAAQLWYSAHFFPPMFLLVAALSEHLPRRAWVAGAAIGGVCAVLNLWNAWHPMWSWTVDPMMEAARVRDDARIAFAGSWNGGRVSYLGGEKIVNIDGLVNDDILAYAQTGTLHCYLVHEKIAFVIDGEDWLTPERAQYLGFADGKLKAAMHELVIAKDGPHAWSIDLDALAKDPRCAEDRRTARSRALRPLSP